MILLLPPPVLRHWCGAPRLVYVVLGLNSGLSTFWTSTLSTRPCSQTIGADFLKILIQLARPLAKIPWTIAPRIKCKLSSTYRAPPPSGVPLLPHPEFRSVPATSSKVPGSLQAVQPSTPGTLQWRLYGFFFIQFSTLGLYLVQAFQTSTAREHSFPQTLASALDFPHGAPGFLVLCSSALWAQCPVLLTPCLMLRMRTEPDSHAL